MLITSTFLPYSILFLSNLLYVANMYRFVWVDQWDKAGIQLKYSYAHNWWMNL